MSSLKLAQLLSEEISLLDDLLQILKDEQQAIVKLETVRMDELNSRKESLAVSHRKLNDSMRNTISDIARQSGAGAVKGLGELLDRLPKPDQSVLMPLREKVLARGASVKTAAELNSGMLERFLGTVNDSLRLLSQVINSSNTYGVGGMMRMQERTSAMIVNREA